MFFRFSKIQILIFVCIFINATLIAQERPFWVAGCFMDAPKSYIEVVAATSWSTETAKQKAYQEVINRRSLTTGTEANVSINDGKTSVTSSHDLIAASRIIDVFDEYIGGGVYKVYLLVQTAKNPTCELESVTITNRYPFSARVFVPGCAQIYKGSLTKGGCMIVAETFFAGGIALTESLRISYLKHSASTSNINTCRALRDVSIAGLVGVYLWSLVDGIVAPGKTHIEIGQIETNIKPYVSRTDIGAVLSLNF